MKYSCALLIMFARSVTRSHFLKLSSADKSACSGMRLLLASVKSQACSTGRPVSMPCSLSITCRFVEDIVVIRQSFPVRLKERSMSPHPAVPERPGACLSLHGGCHLCMHPDGCCVPCTREPEQAAPHQQRIFSSHRKRVHHFPNRQVAHTRYARDIERREVVALKMELKQDTAERLCLWISIWSLVVDHL